MKIIRTKLQHKKARKKMKKTTLMAQYYRISPMSDGMTLQD